MTTMTTQIIGVAILFLLWITTIVVVLKLQNKKE
jgi:hypothetical protein